MASVAMSPIFNVGPESSVGESNITMVSNTSSEDVTDLVQYLNGLSLDKSYEKLGNFLKALSSTDTVDDVLVNWLKQLNDNISLLGIQNERIGLAVLNLDWTTRGYELASMYHKLVLNMVSAHMFYLKHVLNMTVKIFTTVRNDSNAVLENESYKKVHSLLQDIFILFPSAPKFMCYLLLKNFPYFKKPSNAILSYSMNALNVCTYLPSHRCDILGNLINKYLQIDVYCPRNTIELWELEKEENEQIGDCDMEIDSVASEDMAFPLANTLDLLMDGLFKFIECTCYSDGDKKLNFPMTKMLYLELLAIFEQFILPTSRCCHVPYFMFYICSLRPAICENFLEFLWKKVKDPSPAPVRRQIAAFYISSLLARASYISMSTVTACFDMISSWVHGYIINHDGLHCSDMGAHATFYCVCQTLFYVFAFRHKEFISMKNGFKYLRNLNFERIVTCRLNPLKYCQPIIVQNFASVARNYQVAYCYPIIERNNRSLIVTVENFSLTNTFFPFDPYLLKRSKKWIKPIYRVYDAHDDDDVMERENETDLFVEENALFSYGSSPGFKQLHTVSPKVTFSTALSCNL